MSLYAVRLYRDRTTGRWRVPCGSTSYTRLDGRRCPHQQLRELVSGNFLRPGEGVAMFRAESLAHRGRVVSASPPAAARLFEEAVNEGAYK